MPLIVVGLNHKTASIGIREKMSIAEHDIAEAVENICLQKGIDSCIIISTCNRTEFYMSCDKTELAINQFCNWFALPLESIQQHLYIKDELACIEHLFAVASGLDSMVLGEAQILGQVKSSYAISKQHKKLDILLERLFQSAFRVAKSVRSDTDIGKNPVSIANSAVQLSKQIFGKLSQQNILMISAGSTAELLLRYLNKHAYHKLSICNRSLENARKLAEQFNCDSFELNNLINRIADFDLIFTATASKTPVIDSKMIKEALKQRKHRPMVIIDLAVPRDVEVGVKKFNDIFYYAVDDLQKVINQNIKNRQFSAIQAKQIITVEAETFLYWLKGQQHTQLIHNFQKETAKIRKYSLDKALKKLKNGTDAEEVLFYLANNLTNKLNHAPVKAIRTAIQSGDLIKIKHIRQLLNLDNNNDT
ncbi:MAG: glutamyl-tRNA reductase [Alcanivoracaceae bacterium]|nr:glutamyl-tRNA reductase [Alcanivoracaceae bacterium]